MTGYVRKWKCWFCGEPQETIDWPKAEVCEDCRADALATTPPTDQEAENGG